MEFWMIMEFWMMSVAWLWFCLIIDGGKTANNSQTSEPYWEPLEPLLFNKDVILRCHIKDCCPEGTQWTGGRTNSLLTLGRVSNNKAKYEEWWGVDSSFLKIKEFEFEDGNSLYTCFHGFLQFSKNLTISGNNFALLPSDDTMNKNFTLENGYISVSIEFLKVFPEPECNVTFQNLDITEYITSEFNDTNNYLMTGKINVNHQICHDKCSGTIEIYCRIGKHEFQIFEAMADIRETVQIKWIHMENYFVGFVVVSIIFIITIFFVSFVMWRMHMNKGNCMKRTSDVSVDSYEPECRMAGTESYVTRVRLDVIDSEEKQTMSLEN